MSSRELYSELRAAEEDLKKWEPSEHPGIIAQCEKRVRMAKQAIFAAEGSIDLTAADRLS